MNTQNVIVDFEDFLNSYQNRMLYAKYSFIKAFFPIRVKDPLTEEYAYLIGKVIGDGNLDKKFTLRFIGKKEDLTSLCDLIIEKFNLKPHQMVIKRKVAKGVSYLLQVNCSYFGRILALLGAPIGNKTKNNFKVPDWVLIDKILKKRFLQALLEDELTTIKIERCNYSVNPRLKLTKKEQQVSNLRDFMLQVKEAIESFGVKCSHISNPIKGFNTDSQELYFHINRNKRNIIKFKEEIGFRFNQDKVKQLNSCYNMIKSSLNE